MKRQKKYNIFTDASFDPKNNIATYSIIIMTENKILKSFSKRSRIEIKNSTEIETFAVYQAMNLILSCYINKKESQLFCINTDCSQVPIFFENENSKMRIFKNNEDIKKDMIKTYNVICKKLSKKDCGFTLKWISRDLNKIAHNHTYNMLKRIRKNKNFKNSKDDLLINKDTFCEILSNFNKSQYSILIYLFNISNQEGLVLITQKEVSETLNISISITNKTFCKLKEMKVLEKLKNGRYMLLI